MKYIYLLSPITCTFFGFCFINTASYILYLWFFYIVVLFHCCALPRVGFDEVGCDINLINKYSNLHKPIKRNSNSIKRNSLKISHCLQCCQKTNLCSNITRPGLCSNNSFWGKYLLLSTTRSNWGRHLIMLLLNGLSELEIKNN